ncbi:MAG TPA: CpaF family protein [Propionibacteriaceae bacterium]|nr:CpaF family protein [Propionibacteriaceae bacterium]
MKLSERLGARRADVGETPDSFSPVSYPDDGSAPASLATRAVEAGAFPQMPSVPSGSNPPSGLNQRGRPAAPQALDPVGKLKEQATIQLFERMGPRLNEGTLDEELISGLVREELNAIIEESATPLTSEERRRIIREVEDDVLGLGPLEALLSDITITEIMVNGPDTVYVEQKGKLTRSPVRFDDEAHLRRVIDRIVSKVGRRIDEASPLVDARLMDGSRVNAIIPPLAINGSTLTIRKFAKDALGVNDLIGFGTMTPDMADLLRACVQARLNVLVSGGTGTGKTTLLNVLSSFIPSNERIITIEDAVELQLQQDHLVRLESRPANVEGRGEVTIRDLVKNSLRMRPDRIVIGECRGAEALDMLQAMNPGHDGSLSTIHANAPRDAIARLETLVLLAGMDLPLRAIREQITSAIDLIVQIQRLRDGTRRVVAITEVHGMEGQTVTLQDIFLFDYSAGIDANGKFLGKPVATGVRPRFAERFEELGIYLSPRVFGGNQDWLR